MNTTVSRRGERPIVEDDQAAVELVNWLRGEQDRQGWTDLEMAGELSISRPYWLAVVAWSEGREIGWPIRPGMTFLAGVATRYPDQKAKIRGMIRQDALAALL